jgi:hypothetical protein
MKWDTTQLRDLATTTLSLSRSGAREIIRTSKPPQHKNYFPKRPASLRLRQKTTCASRTRLRDRSFREQIPLAASNCDTSNTHTALGRRMSLPSALRPSVLGETNRDPSASARFTDTLHDCVTGHNYLCRQKRRDERVEHGPGACGGGKLNIYWTRRRKKQHHNLKRTNEESNSRNAARTRLPSRFQVRASMWNNSLQTQSEINFKGLLVLMPRSMHRRFAVRDISAYIDGLSLRPRCTTKETPIVRLICLNGRRSPPNCHLSTKVMRSAFSSRLPRGDDCQLHPYVHLDGGRQCKHEPHSIVQDFGEFQGMNSEARI